MTFLAEKIKFTMEIVEDLGRGIGGGGGTEAAAK